MSAVMWLYLAVGVTTFLSCEAFYKPFQYQNMPTYIPTTLEEVQKYLCMKMKHGYCVDTSPAKIIINQTFDFTGSEGYTTEVGCYHRTRPRNCLRNGQLKLNAVNQCNGLTSTKVTYSASGQLGIEVGSNKIIIGQNGGGFRGKGLRLKRSYNVEIRCLKITDINPDVIWGGDALDLNNVNNVLIDGNYIKNIGRQMLVTHFGSNTGVTISNNVFDGNTPYSATCNRAHYWLWLFLGDGDMLTLQNNIIFNTSGRGPHMVAAHNSKSLLHMIQNTFFNIKGTGLIDLADPNSSILVEGNVFVHVAEIIHTNNGHIFMPQNSRDHKACEVPLGRPCLLNTVVKSRRAKTKNSLQVLKDFAKFKDQLAKPIFMKDVTCSWITLPKNIRKYISN